MENSIYKLAEFQNLYSVKETVFLSENISHFIVDWKTRTITVPTGRTILAVLNDHCAEAVIFEADRYYNDHDLSNEVCIIQYAVASRRGGQYESEGYYPVTLIDKSNPSKLLFA